MSVFLSFLAFLYTIYLHTKVSQLEEKLRVRNFSGAEKKSEPVTPALPTQLNIPAAQDSVQTNTVAGRSFEGAVLEWLMTDWLLKVGAFLVLLGLGWFVTYAFAQNWIGPMGRISAGLCVGAAILVAGFLRTAKNEQQGTVIVALGAATLLSTIYAAREVYDFFTPSIALIMMASISACIAVSSVIQKVKTRALIGLVVAALAPFLVVSASPSIVGLYLYLFVILAASVWIVVLTGWIEVLVAAVGIYGVFSVLSVAQVVPPTEVSTMRVLIGAFTILFYGVGVISALKAKQVLASDIFVKSLSALLFLMWVRALIPADVQSFVVLLGAVLTALVAWMLLLQTPNRALVLIHASLSLVYLAVAAALQFDGPAAVLSYIALTTVAVYLAGKITDNHVLAQKFGFPFIPIAFYCLYLLSARSGYYSGPLRTYIPEPAILWSELVLVGILASVLLTLGAYLYKNREHTVPGGIEGSVLYLFGSLVESVILIWFTASKLFSSPATAHAWALFVCAGVGIGLYLYALLSRHYKTQIAGGVLVGGVVIRLLFVEVWDMALVQRVIVFLVIGALLMAGAFVRPKKVIE